MLCSDPNCTGSHDTHHRENLCPRARERERVMNRAGKRRLRQIPEFRERECEQERQRYAALDGFAYSHLLLKHRRHKALTRIGLRGGLPSPATGRKTKQT